jgi:Raf kinase inhibitor-like YbhB/YbcL family protein
MQLTSHAFSEGQTLPSRFSYDGGNVNPPLAWSGAPEGTKSFALIMDDPDVPKGAIVPLWIHWVVFNISASARSIPESSHLVGVRGKGTSGSVNYHGPRPPDREHRYFFRLYALDADINLDEGATAGELQTAMHGHILAQAVLIGRYAPER